MNPTLSEGRCERVRRNKSLRGLVFVSLLSVLCLGSVAAAFADTITVDQAGPPVPDTVAVDPADQPVLDQKMQLLKEWQSLKAGQVSISQYNSDVMAFYGFLAQGASNQPLEETPSVDATAPTRYVAADYSVSCADGTQACIDPSESQGVAQDPSLAGGPDSAYLDHNYLFDALQWPEVTDYYCGPSTAWSVLKGLHADTSFFGEALSPGSTGEHILAALCPSCHTDHRGKYLQTDYWQETPFVGEPGNYPMKNGLNRWVYGVSSAWYVPYGLNYNPTFSGYLSRFTSDIDLHHPVPADLVEYHNATHLDQHPNLNQTIFHWVAIRGYSNWGNNTHYVDPVYGATTIPWNSYVHAPNHRITSSSMWDMVRYRGIMW